MAAIKHKFTVKTNAASVYEALTSQKGLAGWWAKQTLAKAEVGHVNTFTFGNAQNDFEVTELVSSQKVAWRVLKAADDWTDTTILFELEAKESNTIVRFTHSGWRSDGDFFAECNFAWANFMKSLKSYCETGSGTPV